MPENDDKDIWATYAKDVKPIVSEKKKPALVAKKKLPQSVVRAPVLSRKETNSSRPGKTSSISFDRKVERRLRQGEVDIDARIDLHGMRQDEAHSTLNDFIARQIRAGHRTLLVITGKGRNGPGVLRSSLAGWLAASLHAPSILALRPAAVTHGGQGAFYILLKKRKNPHE